MIWDLFVLYMYMYTNIEVAIELAVSTSNELFSCFATITTSVQQEAQEAWALMQYWQWKTEM